MRFQTRVSRITRQLTCPFVYLLLAVGLVACAKETVQQQEILRLSRSGIVAAEEPHAALAALELLKKGGNAADAAVAAFFVLSVTYPVAAGLGAGGTCLAYDEAMATSESIDFRGIPLNTGGFVGVPGAVRGLAALQARYGKLRWSQIVLPAEKLARFGHLTSRATARVSAGLATVKDGSDFAPFIVEGRPVREQEQVKQEALAETLSRIRNRGGGDLYFGETAALFVSEMRDLGLEVSRDNIQSYTPQWRTAKRNSFSAYVAHLPGEGPAGGEMAGAVIAMLAQQKTYFEGDESVRAHLLAKASARAMLMRYRGKELLGNTQPSDLIHENDQTMLGDSNFPDLSLWRSAGHDGTTSVVTLDSRGQAVACVFTMGAPFGTGRMLPDLGFAPAIVRPTGHEGWTQSGTDFIAPIIITQKQFNKVAFVGGATGGPASASTLAVVAINSIHGIKSLNDAVGSARTFLPGRPKELWYENGLSLDVQKSLVAEGYSLEEAAHMGRVNAIVCRVSRRPLQGCTFTTDRRSFGLAFSGVRIE